MDCLSPRAHQNSFIRLILVLVAQSVLITAKHGNECEPLRHSARRSPLWPNGRAEPFHTRGRRHHSRNNTFFTIHGETDKIPLTCQRSRQFRCHYSDHRFLSQVPDQVVHPGSTHVPSMAPRQPLQIMDHHYMMCFHEKMLASTLGVCLSPIGQWNGVTLIKTLFRWFRTEYHNNPHCTMHGTSMSWCRDLQLFSYLLRWSSWAIDSPCSPPLPTTIHHTPLPTPLSPSSPPSPLPPQTLQTATPLLPHPSLVVGSFVLSQPSKSQFYQ